MKCKIKDFVEDLLEQYDVSEITMSSHGVNLAVVDCLRESGVIVNIR